MVTGSCGTIDLMSVALVETPEVIHAEWVKADDSNYALAANEELALAA